MSEYSEYIQEVVKTKKVRFFSFLMHYKYVVCRGGWGEIFKVTDVPKVSFSNHPKAIESK